MSVVLQTSLERNDIEQNALTQFTQSAKPSTAALRTLQQPPPPPPQKKKTKKKEELKYGNQKTGGIKNMKKKIL